MAYQPPEKTVDVEHRSFFRVEDRVLLKACPVDEHSALENKIPQRLSSDADYALMAELQAIDQDNSKHLWSISESHPELALFLKGLNSKMDLIVGKLFAQQQPADHQQVPVSLSEGGLLFPDSSRFPQHSYLALRLTLLPTHHTVMVFGKVISSKAYSGNYSTAVSFVRLKDSERQIIAKHIMQLQLTQRRQQEQQDDE